ncbi:MAG: hypothetical protein FD161_1545 [Limisphaerales bacterium]|nr:MAG: hypothetical protein FD161_1545 [Limisphaerales bacterium]KAG0509359.1 MAG: hypothetical protein E1N63_1464 [Limisphaerales bacterium]TXT52104.1 MAG: hypothetical protein FD140_1037 [Limisphaerales bacterium]
MAKSKNPLIALGKSISKLRSKAGMTTAALAKKSGIKLDCLERLEAGEAEVTVLELAAIAKALHIETGVLLTTAGL